MTNNKLNVTIPLTNRYSNATFPTFYMNGEFFGETNEECTIAPKRGPIPPPGMSPTLPPQEHPIPPPKAPPMSFFANIAEYKKAKKTQLKKKTKTTLLPLKKKSKLPAAVPQGPPMRGPPAIYISPKDILNKLRRTKVPAAKPQQHSPLVRKVYGIFEDDDDEDDVTPLGPSLPRPPKSINMPPMPPKKVQVPRGPTMGKEIPAPGKKLPKSTSLVYLADGEEEVIFTATESENGDIHVDGRRVGDKKLY